jgi:hypothetical protein
MGDLRIYDFSLMRFHNLDTPTPPRKQMVTIRGVTVEDTVNDEVILQFPNSATVNGLLWSELHAVEGVEDGEVRQLLGKSRLDDGGGGPVSWIEGGQALYLADDWSVVYGPSSGCWQRVRDNDDVNICWLGCTDDGATECGAIINSFCDAWLAERGPNANLTLTVPNVRARCRSITTTNGSDVATVASTSGLHAGQLVVGTGIPGGTRIDSVGVDSITLTAAATASGARVARFSAWGYRLGTPISSANSLYLTLKGSGKPSFEATSWEVADTSALGRGGSIFVVDAGVDGVNSGTAEGDPGTYYTFWHIDGVGFLGPGAASTAGVGINAHVSHGNFQISCNNVASAGFDIGFWLRNSISSLGIRTVKCTGNRVNFKLGGGSDVSSVSAPFNASFENCDAEYGDVGLQAVGCQNVTWSSSALMQTNNRHILLGDPTEVSSVSSLLFEGILHCEGHNIYSMGHQPIEVEATVGQAYHVRFRNTFVTFDGATPSLTLPSGTWLFDHCNIGVDLSIAAGTFVDLQGVSYKFGFNSITANANSVVQPHWPAQPLINQSVSGAYAHDWLNNGSVVQLTLTGDTEIRQPTNATVGARVRYEIIQDATGRRRLTLQSGIRGTVFNAGNDALQHTGFELISSGGVWKVSEEQRPYVLYEENVVASTTQTQGQRVLNGRVCHVLTVANANDVVTLPDAEPGLEIVVVNVGANVLQVFPSSGDDLGAGVNASTTIASGASMRFTAYGPAGTLWEAV